MVSNNFFKIVYEDKEIGEFLFRPPVPIPFAFEPNFLSKFDKKTYFNKQ